MRRGGAGVLWGFMGKVYAEAVAWLSLAGTSENPVKDLLLQGGFVFAVGG